MASASIQSRKDRLVSAVAIAFLLVLIAGMLRNAVDFSGVNGSAGAARYVDFDVFHLVGRMAWRGAVAQSYSIPSMLAAEAAESSLHAQMPWTYPPQFDLIVALLALVNKGVAYLMFIGASFGAYLWILRQLAGPRFGEVVIATFPALMVCIVVGQNGFLTGALAGAFALASLRGRRIAGLPLGLMVIKPHLAVGLTVMVLARQSWGVLALATLVTLASAAVSTLAFGPGIWAAFLAGAHDAGAYLRQGAYPMYRMTSLYAAARTLGLPADAGFALQAAAALAACAATAFATLQRWPARQQVGVALLCTLAISPYSYDYDMPIFGLAAGLLAADVMLRATVTERALLLALAWLSTGWWIIVTVTHPSHQMNQDQIVTVSGLSYLLLIVQTLVILRRAAVPARHPPPEARTGTA